MRIVLLKAIWYGRLHSLSNSKPKVQRTIPSFMTWCLPSVIFWKQFVNASNLMDSWLKHAKPLISLCIKKNFISAVYPASFIPGLFHFTALPQKLCVMVRSVKLVPLQTASSHPVAPANTLVSMPTGPGLYPNLRLRTRLKPRPLKWH